MTGSKYLVEEPECLWDSGAVACQSPRLKLWQVGRSAFISQGIPRYLLAKSSLAVVQPRKWWRFYGPQKQGLTHNGASLDSVMGRHGHRCAAAHCWNHDFGRYALLPSTIVREICAPSTGIPLAPVNFNSSAPLLRRVQPASDQRKPRHIERNLQAYGGTNKIATVAAVSRGCYPMSRALRSNTGTS